MDRGGSWQMVKIDANGNTIWSHEYGDPFTNCWALTVIEADNGDLLAAGSSMVDGNVDVIRVNADGEQLWRRQYMNGYAKAIIELKNGNFLVCGYELFRGFLLLLNADGDEIWSRLYATGEEFGASGTFNSMRETDNQVVVSGEGKRSQQEWFHIWLLKVDLEEGGDILWERHHFVGQYCGCNTIISCAGGFVLSGLTAGLNTYLMKVNQVGANLWTRTYDRQVDSETAYSLALLDGGGYGIAGRAWTRDHTLMPFVIRTDENGGEMGRSYYDLGEIDPFSDGMNVFYSIVLGLDNSAIAAGAVNVNDGNYDGLVIKWEADHQGPFFVSWTPEDSLLSCLPGDSIQFSVQGRHQWQDRFNELWFFTNGDTFAIDTNAVTLTFDDLGEYEVNCEIEDGVIAVKKTWVVTAKEFYIRSFQPDSTDLTLRRNDPIDFILDVPRMEGVELDYQWILTGRQEGEIEGEDSVCVNFEMTGEYELAAQVSDGEIVEAVSWDIFAASSLWWWWPHELVMEVPVDTLMEFVVFAFNEESDSLSYLWKLNGDTVSLDAEANINFHEPGLHEIQGFLWDGSDVDSVSWNVTSVVIDEVNNSSHNELPKNVELYAPVPNPFNSSTKITFNLPANQITNLAIFDISGRKVCELIKGQCASGKHEIVFNAKLLTTGIYFINIESGGERQTQKLVLIR